MPPPRVTFRHCLTVTGPMVSSSRPWSAQAESMADPHTPSPGPEPYEIGPSCPACGEPWLRTTQLPGRYRCVSCLQRYELVSQCPHCGEHQTIARMSSTEDMICQHCRHSMLR